MRKTFIALAASPDSGTLLATTQAGLLRSADDGVSWETLSPPEAAVLVAWADEDTVVAATATGRLARTGRPEPHHAEEHSWRWQELSRHRGEPPGRFPRGR